LPYNLPAIATKDKPFRAIRPTYTQQQELLRLYMPVLQAWQTSAVADMAAYNPAQTPDDSNDKRTAAEVSALLLIMGLRFDTFFNKMEAWHRGKWLASVASATGVDAKWMTAGPVLVANRLARRTAASQGNGVVAAARQASVAVAPVADIGKAILDAVASSSSLAQSLSDEARARVRNAIIGGQRSGKPATEVARDINKGLTRSRKRALGIADNETDNFVKAATDARMAEAGLDFGKWEHLAGQKHPRPEHRARNNQLYAADDTVWGELFLPHCHCTKVPVLKLGGFSGI